MDMNGYYGKVDCPSAAIYEAACALDNQDVPLEEWPMKIIAALERAGFVVVPITLPEMVLGEAAMSGAWQTGNPKHMWDFLIAATKGGME